MRAKGEEFSKRVHWPMRGLRASEMVQRALGVQGLAVLGSGAGGDCRGSGKFLEGKEGPGPEEPLMCVKVFLVRKKLRLTEEF